MTKFYKRGGFFFSVLMLVFFISIGLMSLGYDNKTRMLPLLVVMAGIILSVLDLAGEIFPRFTLRVDEKLGGTEGIKSVSGTKIDTETEGDERSTLIFIIVWLIGYGLLVLLVGFHIGTVISLFLSFKFLAKYRWLKTIILTIGTWLFVYVCFDILLKLSFFRGILFGEIVTI